MRTRAVAPVPDGWAWGIDYGLRKIAFGFLRDGDEPAMRDLSWDSPPGPGALAKLHGVTYTFAKQYAGRFPPAAVGVERAFGASGKVNPWMVKADGIVAAAVWQALDDMNAARELESRASILPRIALVPQSKWRKVVIGRGNAGKADSIEWASAFTGGPVREDCAEALAIAAFEHVDRLGAGPGSELTRRMVAARAQGSLL
jgi:Holliday junction resolvasome RuvABC endonuclease subunit